MNPNTNTGTNTGNWSNELLLKLLTHGEHHSTLRIAECVIQGFRILEKHDRLHILDVLAESGIWDLGLRSLFSDELVRELGVTNPTLYGFRSETDSEVSTLSLWQKLAWELVPVPTH